MNKTYHMRCLEIDRGQPLELILRAAVESGDSWEQIAANLGVTRLTLRDWARRLGAELIVTRTIRFKSEGAPGK